MSTVPGEVADLIGVVQYEQHGEFPVERGYIWTSCASVENGNPLFWDDGVAAALTDGPIAPPTTLSLWFRPHHWAPGRDEPALPLQVHFDLKAAFDLPEAVMTDSTMTFGEPVRPGDVLRTRQVLRSVSEPKTTKLGTGRFWVIDVEYLNQHDELVGVERYTGFGYRTDDEPAMQLGAEGSASDEAHAARRGSGADDEPAMQLGAEGSASDEAHAARRGSGADDEPAKQLGDVATGDSLPPLEYDVTATTVVLGALATRDTRPMHHDREFAIVRNGTQDIFLNTPNQAAWFERYVTDWTGPTGRLGRMTFRMRGSIFPGDTMRFDGTVASVETDDAGCGWVALDLTVTVDGDVTTSCRARVALPNDPDDNPWARRGDRWTP